jgi:hypothetical protein
MDTRKFRNTPPEGGAEPAVDAASAVLTLDQCRAMLSRSALLLDHMVRVAHDVMTAAPREVLRAVFVDDAPVAVVEPLRHPTQRPRGRSHPVLLLFKMGLSASRLLRQVLRTLHPEDMGAEPVNVGAAASSLEGLVRDLAGMAKDIGLDPDAA